MPALIRGMLLCCLFLLTTGVGFAQGRRGRDSARRTSGSRSSHDTIALESQHLSGTDTFTLHFDFDRSEIRRIDSLLIYFLRSHRIDSILIIGYTDTSGSPDYNRRLSLRRG
ncbi:MAG TPA: hypothetical protein VNU72_02280, partial [Puia sp.]|nr:hypothetical protein [Puia sp.]